MILVDSDILIDILENSPVWGSWSAARLIAVGADETVAINPVVYAELSVGFDSQTSLDRWLDRLEIVLVETPRAALFRAGRAFLAYRRSGGTRSSLLPDILIGAHAEVAGVAILTRDTRRYRTYFPAVRLIAPDAP